MRGIGDVPRDRGRARLVRDRRQRRRVARVDDEVPAVLGEAAGERPPEPREAPVISAVFMLSTLGTGAFRDIGRRAPGTVVRWS